jgi:formyl-CoA transferase
VGRLIDEEAMPGFLSDIRVLDVGSFVAGPAAATVLGDFGADVIKVEPFEGDAYRTLLAGAPVDYFWLLDSRNKRSLCLDLKAAEGHALILELVARADVFVTNYRAQLLERLRLDRATLCELNPKLVYAHVSGYGDEGAEADRAAFDVTAWWGRSGLQDFVRSANAQVHVAAPGMGDHATAMSLFGAIMSALYRRERTGRGAYVSTSLAANGAWSHGMVLQAAFAGVDWVGMRERGESVPVAFALPYRTRDDRWMQLCVLNPAKEWPALARVLGHPEWVTDEKFATPEARRTNAMLLVKAIGEEIGERTLADLARAFGAAGITYGGVAKATEVLDDPQLRANGIVVETAENSPDYRYTVSSPLKMDGEIKRKPTQAPNIGQHSREVLAELGLTAEAIESLVQRGVVKE